MCGTLLVYFWGCSGMFEECVKICEIVVPLGSLVFVMPTVCCGSWRASVSDFGCVIVWTCNCVNLQMWFGEPFYFWLCHCLHIVCGRFGLTRFVVVGLVWCWRVLLVCIFCVFVSRWINLCLYVSVCSCLCVCPFVFCLCVY